MRLFGAKTAAPIQTAVAASAPIQSEVAAAAAIAQTAMFRLPSLPIHTNIIRESASAFGNLNHGPGQAQRFFSSPHINSQVTFSAESMSYISTYSKETYEITDSG